MTAQVGGAHMTTGYAATTELTGCPRSAPASRPLPCSLEAPGQARMFVQRMLCDVHGADALPAVQLLASELVTHAVLHGCPPISLTLVCQVTEIYVGVRHAGLPGAGDADPQDKLRLALVEKVARASGTESTPDGDLRWCLVRTGAVPVPRSPW